MPYRKKLKAYRAARFLAAAIHRFYPEHRDCPLSQILARLQPYRHSPDFRSVRWLGKSYTFTPAQALIVEKLWTAMLHGTPRVGAAALLEACDMVSDSVAGLFKRSDAWGTLIKSDNGIYWLDIPAEADDPSLPNWGLIAILTIYNYARMALEVMA